jgi:hypothetical protein
MHEGTFNVESILSGDSWHPGSFSWRFYYLPLLVYNLLLSTYLLFCLSPVVSCLRLRLFAPRTPLYDSVFGEDALVNVSVEKKDDGKLTGYIRIRSKTQGIALSLGDRITGVQRGLPEKGVTTAK